MDLNKVMIIGRLTRDPELKTIPSGASVCQLGLATNYVYNNQQTGQKVEQVEYHNVVLWRKLAEIANQYLKKGQRVYVEGRLQTRSWEGQDGKKNYKTEIVVDNMIMLDGGRDGGGNSGGMSRPTNNGPTEDISMNQEAPTEELPTIQQGEDLNVEDIPF
jgi:single-strand DNA-binding protein